MAQTAAVLLAAGYGKRMRSALPKPLHRVAGRPMIQHVIDAARGAGVARIIVVLGHGADQVRPALPSDVEVVMQTDLRGTADAVKRAAVPLLSDSSITDVLVCGADCPLLTSDLFVDLVAQRRTLDAAIAIVATTVEDPTGYGRLIRDPRGRVGAIIEEADADATTRAIGEINAGIYAFESAWLWPSLDLIQSSASGEYYLTDLIALATRSGRVVQSIEAPITITGGVNNRVQLAEAEARFRARVRRELMLSGVTIVDPASTFVDAGVSIGADTVLYPGTIIEGETVIGADCVIGPNTQLVNSRIGNRVVIAQSVIESAEVADDVRIGPFSHLRPGARIDSEVQVGNYAEVKNSRIGFGSKLHHFSYLGDAEVGAGVNIGAGTITCNLDSESKQKGKTIVEDGASIGCDTMLVAPLRVGRDAVTGSGAVVTHDVEPETVVIGVPARPLRRRRPRPTP